MTIIVLVNGVQVETDRVLTTDDIVTLFPPLVGG
jgi:molybdopterin converting factor small subunit